MTKPRRTTAFRRSQPARLVANETREAAARGEYRVVVEKDYLKFSAAHFIAYKGFREPLHGHNYQVSVAISARVGPDGYVLDFGVVKAVTKAVCAELDEPVLIHGERHCLTLASE